jgi:hypothetical protein
VESKKFMDEEKAVELKAKRVGKILSVFKDQITRCLCSQKTHR